MPVSAVIAALLLGSGIVLGSVLALRNEPAAKGDCTGGINLSVAAAPRLAGTLTEVAERYRADSPEVDGRCVTVSVVSRATPDTVEALSTGWTAASAGPAPDIWIPESTTWLALARTLPSAAKLLPESGTTIAVSPVVIAMPRPMAEAIGWPQTHLGWGNLAANLGNDAVWRALGHPEWGPFRVGLAEPASSSAGLSAVVNVVSATQGAPVETITAEAFTQTGPRLSLLTFERNTERVPTSTESLLAGLRDADGRGEALTYLSAFPLSESDLIAYNRGQSAGAGDAGAPKVPLVALYPPDGLTVEEVPFVPLQRTPGDPPRSLAAQDFLAALQGEIGRSALTAAGFRTPDGRNPALVEDAGLLPELPGEAQPAVPGATLAAAARTFAGIHQRGATLAVFDSSGSMAAMVPNSGGKTKSRVAIDAAIGALPLFADESELGLWRFATKLDGDRDYEELVPIGPLTEQIEGMSRRDYLATFVDSLVPEGDTGLYDTALAAFRKLDAEYAPGKVNQVVLLTDGINDDPGSISLDDLVAALEQEFDPNRPVQVITIAYGTDADPVALERIAAATGAKSYQSLDPNNISQVLINALLEREAS